MPRKKKSKKRSSSRKQRVSRAKSREKRDLLPHKTRKAIIITLLIVLTLVVTLSFFEQAGELGQIFDKFLSRLFGYGRYILPLVILAITFFKIKDKKYELTVLNWFGLVIFYGSILGFIHLKVENDMMWEKVDLGQGGGFFGFLFAYPLRSLLGDVATFIILLGLLFVGLFLWLKISFHDLLLFKNRAREMLEDEEEEEDDEVEFVEETENEDEGEEIQNDEEEKGIFKKMKGTFKKKKDNEEPIFDEQTNEEEVKQEKEIVESEASDDKKEDKSPVDLENLDTNQTLLSKQRSYKVPTFPIDILEGGKGKPSAGDVDTNKHKIQKTLESFGISVQMSDVTVGPTFTQYTFRPAQGIKLSRITSLANDLALALAVHPIRIEAPIPGKSLVGIELPNKQMATVRIKELLASKYFKRRKDDLNIVLGKAVNGHGFFESLPKLPHMMIGGATGSGKSVCINSILTSLLYRHSPNDLKLILVDPKKVELSMYNEIPHLLTPVITNTKKTVNALKWCVAEMERRYELLAQVNKRNVQSFNDSSPEKMPYIVIVIDELADLMAVAAKEVEAIIVRLSQMARAVGIHLILATQRPSVNVITGLIKANITSRIAFAVPSGMDSRTILDSSGAEKLIGRGDMLYTSAKLGKPVRIQGCFISEQETKKITDHLKQTGSPDYLDEVVEVQKKVSIPGISSNGNSLPDDEDDPLFMEAKEIVIKAGKASTSYLQRHLRIGYSRAARLIDMLEHDGTVGPAEGSKAREVLVRRTESGMDVDTSRTSVQDQEDGDESRNDSGEYYVQGSNEE